MIQQYHIKHSSFHKGKSLGNITQETGHDFKTVKNTLNNPIPMKSEKPNEDDLQNLIR